MINDYICPSINRCPLYELVNSISDTLKSRDKSELNPAIIKYTGKKYYCKAIRLFDKGVLSDCIVKSIKPHLTDCALIKMMNDNKEILELLKPRESVGGPQ